MHQLTFTVEDCKSPERIERLFRQLNGVLSHPQPVPAGPDLNALAAALAPLISAQLQAGGIAPLNLQSLLPNFGIGNFLQDTHANRLQLYNPNNYALGSIFIETDRGIAYIVRNVSNVKAWVYFSGTYSVTLANIPVDLGTNDAGFAFHATDYSHTLTWSGSVWGPAWALGDDGNGYYWLFEDAPAGWGSLAWQICDGSTVARLNPDATTTNVTTPNLATAAYLKGGTTSAAVAAASGATDNESSHTHDVDPPSTTTGAPSSTVDVEAGVADTTVAASDHTHDVDIAQFTSGAGSAHNHGPGTLELRNKQARLYYRR